uniref:F-box domain-containing protein n=1 Tax=Ditylenchus dipsaci TaxID=166011 RepID=A0A915DW32_9BILA
MRIPPEILHEILSFSTQLTLAQLSTVNFQFHNIIKHSFACFPYHTLRPVDVKKNLSCTLGIGSIRLDVKEAVEIFRPKFVRIYNVVPISQPFMKCLFTNFAGSAKELTVEGYGQNYCIDLFYSDFSICPTLWICGNIQLDPLQIVEHLKRSDKQIRLSLNARNQRQIRNLVNVIQKDFYGSTKAQPFFLKAEYYFKNINVPSDRVIRLFNKNTAESLQINQTYCGYGLIELECIRGF